MPDAHVCVACVHVCTASDVLNFCSSLNSTSWIYYVHINTSWYFLKLPTKHTIKMITILVLTVCFVVAYSFLYLITFNGLLLHGCGYFYVVITSQ